jgi:hypothetical protein
MDNKIENKIVNKKKIIISDLNPKANSFISKYNKKKQIINNKNNEKIYFNEILDTDHISFKVGEYVLL